MPQYTYRCKNCDHQFSIEQRMSDPALTDCPECAGQLRKVINQVSGVVFKGSGFYVTDNRNGKSKKSSGAKNGENGKEPESKAEKSGDSDSSKPEKTAKAAPKEEAV